VVTYNKHTESMYWRQWVVISRLRAISKHHKHLCYHSQCTINIW